MLPSLILQLSCGSAYITYSDACNKATDAFLKQTGMEQHLTSLERYSTRNARKIATQVLGDTTMRTLASATAIYKIVQNKEIIFPLPNIGISDSLNTTLTPASGKVDFGWSIR